MSEQAIQTISINVGAQAGTVNRPLFRVPKSDSAFGGITITGAYIMCGAAATSVMQLLNLGTALGTAVTSVIGTLNGTLVANVQKAIAITTAYQASGTWLGLGTGAGGSLDTVTNVTIEFKWGK
jgi:hypothetical protein